MFKALKLCPDAVVVRGSMDKYAFEGGRIRQMMKDLTPIVEPLSIDEAFLDLNGTQRLHGLTPAQSLIRLQKRILDDVGVTVSVGLSYNKFLAKTASDLDKPHGFAVLGKADAQDFLKDKPVGFIFGIGALSSRVQSANPSPLKRHSTPTFPMRKNSKINFGKSASKQRTAPKPKILRGAW